MYGAYDQYYANQGYNPQQQQQLQQQIYEQQYNNYYQQMQQRPQQGQQIQQTQAPQQPTQQIVYVASIEEVRAFPVDWTGGITYFMDKANSCIYTKQVADTGIPEIKTYKLDTNEQKTTEYVTREEFDNVKATLESLLNSLGGAISE